MGEYLKWCDDTKQSYKLEKRKFLVHFKKSINDTAHINVYKSSGNMYAKFDWDALDSEGKFTQHEEEDYDEIDQVCSEEEEEQA